MTEILGLLMLLIFGAYMVGGWPYVAVMFTLALIAAGAFAVRFGRSRG